MYVMLFVVTYCIEHKVLYHVHHNPPKWLLLLFLFWSSAHAPVDREGKADGSSSIVGVSAVVGLAQ